LACNKLANVVLALVAKEQRNDSSPLFLFKRIASQDGVHLIQPAYTISLIVWVECEDACAHEADYSWRTITCQQYRILGFFGRHM
jgi:hypothetical protein